MLRAQIKIFYLTLSVSLCWLRVCHASNKSHDTSFIHCVSKFFIYFKGLKVNKTIPEKFSIQRAPSILLLVTLRNKNKWSWSFFERQICDMWAYDCTSKVWQTYQIYNMIWNIRSPDMFTMNIEFTFALMKMEKNFEVKPLSKQNLKFVILSDSTLLLSCSGTVFKIAILHEKL